MNVNPVLNGVKIINKAIECNISVQESSMLFNYSKDYIKRLKYDIKRGRYNSDDIDKFNKALEKYENITKKNILTKQDHTIKQSESNVDKLTVNVNENVMDINYNYNYPAGHIKTLDELLDRCKVNRDLWDVLDYTLNKWDVTSFRSNNPRTIENFQVKARLQKKVELSNTLNLIELFKESIENYKPKSFTVKRDRFEESNNLLEICLFDAHFSKLVYENETNDTFNSNILEENFLNSVKTFIDRAKVFGFNRILFPVGNDFFNSDGISYSTTGGTPQNSELVWQEVFRRGTKLIMDAIYLMRDTGVNVDVLMIPGNHDYSSNFYLGEYLSAWFKDDEIVNIVNGANPRKYYLYGKVLLGFTHGNEEKKDYLPMLMANEKEMWAMSEYREWHLGHYHKKIKYKYNVLDKFKDVDEIDGVTLRHLSSLSGADSWHNKKGYILSKKAGDGFIWNADKGLLAHININI